MKDNRYFSIIIKLMLIAAVAYIFAVILLFQVKIAFVLGFGFLAVLLMLSFFQRIEEQKFILIFFFIYPLLPGLWGINLPFGLPVLRAHRMALVILILYLLRNGLFIKYYSNFFKSKLFNFQILFIILSMFATSFLSTAKASTIFFTISFIVEFFILSVVVFNAFKSREDIESFIMVLISSALVLCVLGLFEKFSQFNVFTIFGSYLGEETLEFSIRGGEIRINGPFVHAISFGAYLAMILPLILYKFRDNYIKFFLALALIAAAILATQSRSAQICMLFAFFSFFMFIEKKKLGILAFASIPILIVFYERILTFIEKLNPFITTDAALLSSTTDRALQFNHYIGYVKNNLLFGYGLERIPPLLRDYFDGSAGVYSTSIDNFYLGYTCQFGIVGLLSWLFLMLAVLIKPMILFNRDIWEDKLLLTLLCLFLIFIIINFIVLLLDFHFLFWIYLGILTRIMVIKKEGSSNQGAGN